jgi:hypothetical protein
MTPGVCGYATYDADVPRDLTPFPRPGERLVDAPARSERVVDCPWRTRYQSLLRDRLKLTRGARILSHALLLLGALAGAISTGVAFLQRRIWKRSRPGTWSADRLQLGRGRDRRSLAARHVGGFGRDRSSSPLARANSALTGDRGGIALLWASPSSCPSRRSGALVVLRCGRDLLLLRARHGKRSLLHRGRDTPDRRAIRADPLGLGEPFVGGRSVPRLPCSPGRLSPPRVRRRALSPLRRPAHLLRLPSGGDRQLGLSDRLASGVLANTRAGGGYSA